jgi:hypothetical protein
MCIDLPSNQSFELSNRSVRTKLLDAYKLLQSTWFELFADKTENGNGIFYLL